MMHVKVRSALAITNSSVHQVAVLLWEEPCAHIHGPTSLTKEKVKFLLYPSESSTGLLSDDRHNRLVIQFRVVGPFKDEWRRDLIVAKQIPTSPANLREHTP